MYTRNNIKNVESSSGSLEDRRSLPFVLKHTPVLRTRQHVITFYVQKEQYEKDIESSRGSLEDRRYVHKEQYKKDIVSSSGS
jgi:hypothetical protein